MTLAHASNALTAQVIEAHYLFGADYDHIDIVIHPQSIIHSMVETQDSSVLAQVRFVSAHAAAFRTLETAQGSAASGMRS